MTSRLDPVQLLSLSSPKTTSPKLLSLPVIQSARESNDQKRRYEEFKHINSTLQQGQHHFQRSRHDLSSKSQSNLAAHALSSASKHQKQQQSHSQSQLFSHRANQQRQHFSSQHDLSSMYMASPNSTGIGSQLHTMAKGISPFRGASQTGATTTTTSPNYLFSEQQHQQQLAAKAKSPSCKRIFGQSLTSQRIPISQLSVTKYADLLAITDNDPRQPDLSLHIPIDTQEIRDNLKQFQVKPTAPTVAAVVVPNGQKMTTNNVANNQMNGKAKLPSVFMSFRSVKEINRSEFIRMHQDDSVFQNLDFKDLYHTGDDSSAGNFSIQSAVQQQQPKNATGEVEETNQTPRASEDGSPKGFAAFESNAVAGLAAASGGSPKGNSSHNSSNNLKDGINSNRRPLTKIELSLVHNKDISTKMQLNLQAEWESCVEDVKRQVELQESIVKNMPKIRKYPIFKMKTITNGSAAVGVDGDDFTSEGFTSSGAGVNSNPMKAITQFKGVSTGVEDDAEKKAVRFGMQGGKNKKDEYPIYWYAFEQNHWKPDIRESQSLVIDANKAMLFGGVGNQLYNQMTELDLESFKWEEAKVEGNVPSARFGHSCCIYKRNLVFFGGEYRSTQNNVKFKDCLLDVHFYNLDSKTWKLITCSGGPLQPRKYHAAAILGRNMLVSGGINNKDHVLKDIWFLDLGTQTWSEADTPYEFEVSLQGCVPVYHSQRCGKINLYKISEVKLTKWGANIPQEGVYFFGGKGSKGDTMGDLRILRTECKPMQWIRPETKGIAPKPRYGHSMTYSQSLNMIVIHGGKNDSEDAVYFNDTFLLNIEDFTWLRIASYGKPQPHRYNHSAAVFQSKLIIFGGINMNGFLPPFVSILELDNGISKRMNEKDQSEAAMLSSNPYLRNSQVMDMTSGYRKGSNGGYTLTHNIKVEHIPFQQRIHDLQNEQQHDRESQQSQQRASQAQQDLINSLSFQNFKSFLPIPRSNRKPTFKKTLTITQVPQLISTFSQNATTSPKKGSNQSTNSPKSNKP